MTPTTTVIVITQYGMGNGPKDLQITLIGKYLELLNQLEELPKAICFYTEGVKLVVKGSPVLKQLHSLEKRGVRIVICSTCLDYFELGDEVAAGVVGGMTDILEALDKADKVITI